MPTLRTIKRRTEGVKKIQKVAKALEVVATTKLKKIQKETLRLRCYAEGIKALMKNVAARTQHTHPLLKQRGKGGHICLIIITSDRGLCGGFNNNVIKPALDLAKEVETKLMVIGRKGRNYFTRKNFNLLAEYIDLDEGNFKEVGRQLTKKVLKLYRNGEFEQVDIIYNKFRLHLLGEVNKFRVLPVGVKTEEEIATDYLYEPEPEKILDELIPEYVEVQINQAWLESRSSEEMARMLAMKQAKNNADELIDKLMLDYHKSRQAIITREIIEVVSSVPA